MEKWLSLEDVKQKKFNKSSWVPLRKEEVKKRGEYGYVGYEEEVNFIVSIAVYKNKILKAEKYDWNSLSNITNRGYCQEGKYFSSDIFFDEDEELGVFFVLDQPIIRENFKKWYLHQDIILTLDLEKEGDIWITPTHAYEEVIREVRDVKNEIISIEIKAEYLKDYLAARDMNLYILSYSDRRCITETPIINDSKEENKEFVWNLYSVDILEGKDVFGDIFVHKVSRTDVSEFDDIPDLSDLPTDDNIKSESYIINKSKDKKTLTLTESRLWKKEWVIASDISSKVRKDNISRSIFFKVDESGREVSVDQLINSGKWLWFEPNIINLILEKRDTKLIFYTKETGEVICGYGYRVYFGVNDIGKINVYSKDICFLPVWAQKIFSSNNITPEGGISKELRSIQILANDVTTAPLEEDFKKIYKALDILFFEKNGIHLFNSHLEMDKLINKVHRFVAYNYEGIFKLAKEISRVIVESINTKGIKQILKSKDELRSIKALEKYIGTLIDPMIARKLMTPLVGIYELRNRDAHLYGENIQKAFKLLEIDEEEIPLRIGEKLILLSCKTMYTVTRIIFEDKNK